LTTTPPDDAKEAYRAAFREGLKPDPVLTVSEWANENRYLPSSSSPEPGRWRTSRTPYLKEIMDCLSPSSPVTEIAFMKGAQVGGSECGNNFIGYIIDQAPGPVMLVEPTVEIAKRYSKQRIAPAIRHSPALCGKVKDSRGRDSGNTILVKEFEGGLLVLTGANSAAGLRSMPVRFLIRDEIDAYPDDCEGEGDPLSLSEARTSNYGLRKKIFDISTPTEAGFSKIEKRYDASDQRRYFVPCPFCKGEQWLRWGQIAFEKDADYNLTAPVRYRCEQCGELIDERYKTWMLESGRWIATAPGPGKPAGFHLSSLYSPLGWRSWADIVRKFLKARKKRDTLLLKSWTNTDLGETWEEEGLTVDDGSLMSRREDFGGGDPLPAGILLLTAGVDVHDDRLEASLKGWGIGEESWNIQHAVFRGNPETSLKVWRDLDDWLLRSWLHESGNSLRVAAACVDSGGHATQQVYDFCRKRESRRIWAIIGRAGAGLPLIKIGARRTKAKVALGIVGTDTAKGLIFSRLGLSEFGPGYMHFSRDLDDEYFRQLTAEKLMTKHVRGVATRVWKKVRARNEALDCEVYAIAAYSSLNANLERIANRAETQAKQAKAPPPDPDGDRQSGVKLPIKIPPRRGGWVTRW